MAKKHWPKKRRAQKHAWQGKELPTDPEPGVFRDGQLVVVVIPKSRSAGAWDVCGVECDSCMLWHSEESKSCQLEPGKSSMMCRQAIYDICRCQDETTGLVSLAAAVTPYWRETRTANKRICHRAVGRYIPGAQYNAVPEVHFRVESTISLNQSSDYAVSKGGSHNCPLSVGVIFNST